MTFEFVPSGRNGKWLLLALALCAVAQNIQAANPTHAKERVELQCGAHKVAIDCGKAKPGDPPDERVCVHNTLSFTGPDGKIFTPKQPKNFRDEFEIEKTPTSIGCSRGTDGKFYVSVLFAAGWAGPYMLYEMFSESGERLTVNGKNFDRINSSRGLPDKASISADIEGVTK